MLRPSTLKKRPSKRALPHRFVFIIGAMKSGTTSMFDLLSQHPQICASKTKEPDYFQYNQPANALRSYLALWDWDASKHLIAIEASVSYTKAPYIQGVPGRIHQANLGSYKFIYILRNPLDRIESQIRHGLFAKWGKSLDYGIPDDAVAFSKYATQIREYLKYFPRSDFFIVTLEEFKIHPHDVLQRLCNFLNIDRNFDFQEVNTPRNSGQFFNSTSLISLFSQTQPGQYIAHHLLPMRLKQWIRQQLTPSANSADSAKMLGRWRLTAAEKTEILRLLETDLAELQSKFGVDIEEYWKI